MIFFLYLVIIYRYYMENKDNFIYEVSKEDQTQMKTVENQQWIFANDNSNSNYSSNQITFDLSSFYNTSSLIDWKSAYIQIPLVTVVDLTGASEDNPNIFCLKNGYANIINSIQVECSNSTVNQIANNLNYYTNFKIYTNKSKDWFESTGPSLGYYGLDSSNSWKYYNTSSNNGYGSTNNNNFLDNASLIGAGVNGYIPGNESMFHRTRSFLRPDNGTGNLYPNGSLNLLTKQNMNSMGMDYVDNISNTRKVYYSNAVIRLGDLAAIFDSLGLARCYIRLIVNVNVGAVSYTCAAGVPTANVVSSFSYNTCPFMIAQQNALNNPMTNITAVSVRMGIVRALANDNTSYVHNFTAARIYAPQVLLNPEKEKIYRMNNSQKMLIWNDVFSTSLLEQPAGGQVNYVISNGLSNLVGVLAIPMVSASVNKAGFTGFSPALSPWATEPSTTSPLMSLYNYNIYCGGKALLPSNLIFNFNTFNDQFLGVNALNGGGFVSGDLCSGSIDFNKWSNNYRYYYLDAERRNEADNSPKSISVQFTNNNAVPIDIFFFCVFKRTATMDIVSGQLQML